MQYLFTINNNGVTMGNGVKKPDQDLQYFFILLTNQKD